MYFFGADHNNISIYSISLFQVNAILLLDGLEFLSS